jgi:hypothetical protein
VNRAQKRAAKEQRRKKKRAAVRLADFWDLFYSRERMYVPNLEAAREWREKLVREEFGGDEAAADRWLEEQERIHNESQRPTA